MAIDRLCRFFDERNIEYVRDVSLSEHSTFRIGGVGEIGIFPDSADKLSAAITALRECGVDFHIIGNGSNILFLDGRLKGAFIFTKSMNKLRLNGDQIVADCGVSLAALANFAYENSLTGLEFARGIPGTVGGALYMNAGAYGGEISQVTVSSRALDTESGNVVEIYDHDFGYRRSKYLENKGFICLEGGFKLACGDRKMIAEAMSDFAKRRREKQPLSYPSAGSYFKRPEGHFAGKLIEDAGLKGLTVGGASVSTLHAGFIINKASATAADVLALEEKIRAEVQKKYGVTLEREVRVIG